jgi:hypothetical protein
VAFDRFTYWKETNHDSTDTQLVRNDDNKHEEDIPIYRYLNNFYLAQGLLFC